MGQEVGLRFRRHPAALVHQGPTVAVIVSASVTGSMDGGHQGGSHPVPCQRPRLRVARPRGCNLQLACRPGLAMQLLGCIGPTVAQGCPTRLLHASCVVCCIARQASMRVCGVSLRASCIAGCTRSGWSCVLHLLGCATCNARLDRSFRGVSQAHAAPPSCCTSPSSRARRRCRLTVDLLISSSVAISFGRRPSRASATTRS